MDKIDFDAQVKDIQWVTTTKGRVNPIIVLDQKYEAVKGDDSQTFDGIMFTDVNDIKSKKCGVGAKVKIKCDDQLNPLIEEVTEESDKIELPTHCRFCKTELKNFEDLIICINHLCIAQGRTPVFKLMILSSLVALEREDVVLIHKYLHNFPYKGSPSTIEHIYAYLCLISEIFEELPTTQRKDLLVQKFGKEGEYLWKWEVTVYQKLKKGLKPSELWYILGLPFQEKDLKKVEKYDVFKKGLKGKEIKKLKLSSHGEQVIFNNNQLVRLVLPVLSKLAK